MEHSSEPFVTQYGDGSYGRVRWRERGVAAAHERVSSVSVFAPCAVCKAVHRVRSVLCAALLGCVVRSLCAAWLHVSTVYGVRSYKGVAAAPAASPIEKSSGSDAEAEGKLRWLRGGSSAPMSLAVELM